MISNHNKACVLLLLLIWAGPAVAAEIVVPEDARYHANITPDVEWQLDTLSNDRVCPGPCAPPESGYVPLGLQQVNDRLSNGAKWYHFRVRNAASRVRTVYARLDNPRLSNVQFYATSVHGEKQYQVAGLRVPKSMHSFSSRAPSFRFTLDPGETGEYWIRVANRGWFSFRIELFDVNSYLDDMQREGLLLGWIYGALGILMVLSLMFYVVTWDRDFLMNFVLAFMGLFYELTAHGTVFQYLFTEGGDVNDVLVTVSFNLLVASVLLMTWIFLRKEKLPLYWDVLLPATSGLAVFASLARILSAGLWVNRLTQALAVLVIVFILGASLCALVRGQRAARFLLLAWSVMLVGTVLMHLQWLDVISRSFMVECSVHVGVALAPMLVAVALYDRIRISREEYRVKLEAEVSQRTAELKAALQNVKTLQGLIPICAKCKRVREDSGYWRSIEQYISQRSEADFTHGICPECIVQVYGAEVGQKVMEGMQDSSSNGKN